MSDHIDLYLMLRKDCISIVRRYYLYFSIFILMDSRENIKYTLVPLLQILRVTYFFSIFFVIFKYYNLNKSLIEINFKLKRLFQEIIAPSISFT